METTITFDGGTLTLSGLSPDLNFDIEQLVWDERTLTFRCPAHCYKQLILTLLECNIAFTDSARSYDRQTFALKQSIAPRPHQQAALEAWEAAHMAASVCLPTGAGKTILAVMAIARSERPTLVVVPTIELMHQWYGVLNKFFDAKIGLIGAGNYEITALTVSTYDSARIHIERLGNRFGLIIFDECHHLPAQQNQAIALMAIAPYRLGLSATFERADTKESFIYDFVGPLVYRAQIQEMIATTLSPYDIVTIEVPMSEVEWALYESQRKIYLDFLRKERINFSRGNGWMDFVAKSSRSSEGRKAMSAFIAQKRCAQASENKLVQLWKILCDHQGERILVFTDDNAFAYRIGREFLVPVLTHQTRTKERVAMLDSFRHGHLKVLATSKVLNEGVDVPEASVGVVLSGSGTVREHVQRLGRILRHQQGKRATLYEVISKGTNEQFINRRRRQHDAYQGPNEGQKTWRQDFPNID